IDKMFFMLPNHKATYTKSSHQKANDYIQENELGKEDLINSLLELDNTDKIEDFGKGIKELLSTPINELKELFKTNILFNDTLNNNFHHNKYMSENNIN